MNLLCPQLPCHRIEQWLMLLFSVCHGSAFIHNLINKNAKEILLLEIDLKSWQRYSFQSAFHWGSRTNIYQLSVFVLELLVYIFFLLC